MTWAQIEAIDSAGLLRQASQFGEQCRQGLALFQAPAPVTCSRVVVCGMGGSASAGDFAQALCHHEGRSSVVVVRGYDLPAWVASDDLVVVISYSGNTEESLSCLRYAIQRGIKPYAVTSGGELMQACERGEAILIAEVPGGSQPRMALGFMLMPLVKLLQHAKALPEYDFESVFDSLQYLGNLWSPGGGDVQALNLAAHLKGKIPLLYGVGELGGVLAYRWKTQLNENVKVPAIANAIPEQNHNEILAWGQGGELGVWAGIWIQPHVSSPRNGIRLKATQEELANRIKFEIAQTCAASVLEKALSLSLLGDFVSLYLAMLCGIDPTPIPGIDRLKAVLSSS